MNFFHRHRLAAAVRLLFTVCAGWSVLAGLTARAAAAALPVYTLDDCLDIAARQNPQVRSAAKGVEVAHGLVIQARSGIFPSLTTTGYYQRRETSIATNGGTLTGIRPEDYYGDVRVTQSLYSSGAVRSRIAAAVLGERIARLDQQVALATNALQVREAFFSTLGAEQSIGVLQQAVDLLAAQLKDQRNRLAAGLTNQVNVNRAQVSLANEQPALLQARSGVRTAYATLSQVLGISYGKDTAEASFRVRGTLEYRPFSMSLEECLGRALALRPEIEIRKLALDVNKQQMVVEKAATRPQVAVFASYDIFSEPSQLAVKDNFSGYTLGVAASWALFDGFLTLGKVRGLRAARGEAEAQLVAARLQVETDVGVAFDQLKTAEETLKPQGTNIALANETLALTTRNLDAGLNTTQLDVLQSRVDLTRAQTIELGGRLAYNLALARLERAMASNRPLTGSGAVPVGTPK